MGEPIEFYEGFDTNFFGYTRLYPNIPDDRDPEVQEISEKKYKQFLEEHRELLNDVLLDLTPPQDVSKEIFKQLYDAGNFEKYFYYKLRRPADGNPLKVSEQDLFDASGISSLTEEQKNYFVFGTPFHLARLIFPIEYSFDLKGSELEDVLISNVCRTFGIDYVRYVTSLDPKDQGKDAQQIQEVIGMEGPGVVMFWTLAPYVHDQLVSYGLESNESMGCIMDWVRKVPDNILKDKRICESAPYDRGNYFFDHSPKFMDLGFSPNLKTMDLSYDDRMPSHLGANMLSRTISRELYKTHMQTTRNI